MSTRSRIEQSLAQIPATDALAARIRQSQFLRSLPFWLPAGLIMALAVYGAIGWNFVVSLTDFQGLTLPSYNPATFDVEMYARAVSDPVFWNALKNTFLFMIVFTTLCLLVGLGLAILIDQQIRFENLFRTIYLLPFSLSFVVTAKFWLWMYNSQTGVINTVLQAIGLGAFAVEWFSPQFKFVAIVIALTWQFSGYAMVVYLAGLRQIPTAHYEAAKVDGASKFSTYREVIIPQLGPSTMSAAVVLMVFTLKAFDFLYALFGPTPGPSMDILSTMMYRQAYGAARWSYGAAIAMILFVMALGVIAPYFWLQYRRGEI
ncbi:carbohydrate ABC transporter permease [Halobellus ruber]|uniref:Sugar ABC transporter permease n=1 Tax=Halobellus ruber TaxID=2761102 RepID=A0A7J9SQ28_9EURY|nr:sugar ABC transporter permease [Halobellus ruber]